jgi:hypothetical protein
MESMLRLEMERLPETLRSVSASPLFAVRFDVRGPTDLGITPGADRRIGVITGGAFRGKRLQGVVLDGGSDWQTVRSDGAWTLDVRVVLKTDDGALIGMTYRGIRAGPPQVLARLAAGGVDPSTYYFRSTPMFETSDARYDWLNRIVAVGIGHRPPEGPVYSIFEIH